MEQLEARKIAARYAKALLDAADEQKALDKVTDNINALQRVYLEVPELNRFFSNPVIPTEEKKAVVEKQFQSNLHAITANLLNLLVENDRISLLPELITLYLELIQQREGIAQAEVIVPVPLKDKQEKALRSTLEKIFGYRQVEINSKVDPSILAGAIVKIGDKIIDGSYHGKLEMLRRQVG